MGTQVRDIINVAISIRAAAISRTGFGIPMLLVEHSKYSDRTRRHSSVSSLEADGFISTDNAHKMASRIMGQEFTPTSFILGRKLADVNAQQTVSFTGTPTAGTWTLTLDAQTTSALAYNVAAGAVETALEALSNITSVTVTGDMTAGFVITFDGADANTPFNTFTVNVSALTGVTAGTVTVNAVGSANQTWAEALADIRVSDDSWYAVAAETHTDANVEALADAIEALSVDKIYIFSSSESDIIAAPTTDIVSVLKAKTYNSVAAIYSTDAANFPECAWLGGMLPKTPGSVTWAFKPLVGITPDVLTDAAVANLKAKNCNYYETLSGANRLWSSGKMVGGRYIDVQRGADALKADIAESILDSLATVDKLPFTNPGIALVQNIVSDALQRKVNDGFLVEGSTSVTVPDIADVSAADKGNRILNNVTFSATMAGAIHEVVIVGTLQE